MAKDGTVKRGVATKALEALKHQVRWITRRSGGRSITQVAGELRGYLRGWKEYFKLAETTGIFRTVDGWIHRRLRALQLTQWKRGHATRRELRARGLPEWLVQHGGGHGRRWWWASALGAMQTALPGASFDRLGVPRPAV